MTNQGEVGFMLRYKKADAVWIVQQLCNEYVKTNGIIPDLLCINVALQPYIEACLYKSSSNPFPVASETIRWYFVPDDLELDFKYCIITHSRRPGKKVTL